MKVTVTGGTGFIGRRLVGEWLSRGWEVQVLGRTPRPGLAQEARFSIWDGLRGEPPVESLAEVDAVIHLAGEPVAQRWTPEAKRRIRASRVEGTHHLVQGLARCTSRPAVLVSASAIGIYGSRGEEQLCESSTPGSDFLATTTLEWEQEARQAESLGIRVVCLRIGLVLGRGGGALERMLPPFRMGIGGRLGSGRQWMSWIHIDDLIAMVQFAVENASLRGSVNATAPAPVRNTEFTLALGRALRRPALFPVPEFAVRLLFGEMAGIVLGSQKVLPRTAEAAGFRFQHGEVGGALRNLLAAR